MVAHLLPSLNRKRNVKLFSCWTFRICGIFVSNICKVEVIEPRFCQDPPKVPFMLSVTKLVFARLLCEVNIEFC